MAKHFMAFFSFLLAILGKNLYKNILFLVKIVDQQGICLLKHYFICVNGL